MNRFINKYLFLYPAYFFRLELLSYISNLRKFKKINNLSLYVEGRIKAILLFADTSKNSVDYIKENSFSDLADDICYRLQSFPLMDKKSARKYGWGNKDKKIFLDKRSTSGSTGEPFVFYKDRSATAAMDSIQSLAFSWHGILPGDKQARFWGMPSGKNRHIAILKDVVKNRIRFSAFDLSTEGKRAFYLRLLKYKPVFFYGYPSLILEFGRFLKSQNLSLSNVPLKGIIGTGEYVSADEREEFQKLFGLPFIGEYGCTEVGVIGFDCRYGNMHLMSPNIHLEVVDENGKAVAAGIDGEFVVTELHARHRPFVRYRLGDRGRFLDIECPCGCGYPVIEVSSGRKDDFILTPEGNKIYDAILAYTLKEGVLQFKAVQTELDKLVIDVIPNENFTQALKEKYISLLKSKISDQMNVEINLVNHIEREKSGKLRYFMPYKHKDCL